jgi:hypothetical protein
VALGIAMMGELVEEVEQVVTLLDLGHNAEERILLDFII